MQTKYLLLILALPLFACEYVNDRYIKPMVAIPVIFGDTLRGRIIERTDTTITLYNLKGFEGLTDKYFEINHRSILVEEIGGYRDGMARILINGKTGFIDTNGRIVVDPIYDDMRSYFDGLAVVEFKGKFGCINKLGKYVIRPIYRYMTNHREGIVICYREDGWKEYRDSDGELRFLNLGRGVRMFSEGLAYVEEYEVEGGVFGRKYYVNKKGEIEILLDDSIKTASDFHEGLARASQNGLYGFIDRNGSWVIPPQYQAAGYFHNGLVQARFENEEKFGIINKENELIIEHVFESVGRFHNGAAPASVMIDSSGMEVERWGIIDINGDFTLKPIYNLISDFNDNWATVVKGNEVNYVNPDGQFLFEFSPNWVRLSGNGLYPYKGDGEWSVVDNNNTPKFDYSRSMTMND